MSRPRRWLVAILTAAAVVLSAAAAFWYAFVPHWRPALREGEQYGIDVSAHQGDIDWDRVADDEIGFAYIKASEGRDFPDRRFDENWAEARRFLRRPNVDAWKIWQIHGYARVEGVDGGVDLDIMRS